MITRRLAFSLCLLAVSSCSGGLSRSATTATVAAPGLLEDKASFGERGERGATYTSTGGRVLIRDADLTFEFDGDDQQRALRIQMTGVATSMGGYAASEGQNMLTLRIPSGRLDEAIPELEKIAPIKRRHIQVQEVTEQHTDLSIRIENGRKLRARLQVLLDNAKDVKEILEVEKELARVTQELELYEGQMRLLENRIQLSTVNVYFEPLVQPGPIGWVFYGVYSGVKWLFIWD